MRGCQQKEGEIDFKDTFSPVVDMTSCKNMNMQIFDVKTAFLYGHLEDENYMEIPEGYKNAGKICLLKGILWSKTSTIAMVPEVDNLYKGRKSKPTKV